MAFGFYILRRDDRFYVIVQRLRLVVLRQGFQRGIGEISIRHDTAGERHKKQEKNEAARSHGLLLFFHHLLLDHVGDHDVRITALDGLRFHLKVRNRAANVCDQIIDLLIG